MDAVTVPMIYGWIRDGLLAFGVLAFVMGWVVPRWVYDALKLSVEKETVPRWVYDKLVADCETMTKLAERNAELAARATLVAEKVVPEKPGPRKVGTS